MKIRKLRSIICLCLVFALLSPTFTFAISDGASDVAEKTIFDNAVDMRGNGSRSTTYTARIMQGNTNEEDDCRAAENGLLDSGSYTTTSNSGDGLDVQRQKLVFDGSNQSKRNKFLVFETL